MTRFIAFINDAARPVLSSSIEQFVQIEGSGEHREFTVRISRPLLSWPIPVEFHPIAVWISKIERLAHAVVSCAFEGYTGSGQSLQCVRQCSLRRIQDSQMIQPGRPGGWSITASALPCIEADVVMVAAR